MKTSNKNITNPFIPEEIITTPFIETKEGKKSLEDFIRKYSNFGTNWGAKPEPDEIKNYLENAERELMISLTKEKLLEIHSMFKTKNKLEKALWTPLNSHLISQLDTRIKRFKYIVTKIHNLAKENFINEQTK
jgi:hypothetical protein